MCQVLSSTFCVLKQLIFEHLLFDEKDFIQSFISPKYFRWHNR